MKTYKFKCVDSTNTVAKQLAREGADEGTLVTADRQDAGRGRLGRNFFSPDGGLYMSLLLRPEFSAADARLITTAAAVAVCRVLERKKGNCFSIKWVNDIYKDGRKVCGILTESAPSPGGKLEWAILGIGINLFPTCPVPSELESILGFAFDKEDEVDKTALAEEIRDEFFLLYPTLCERTFAAEYRDRMFLTGKRVSVIRDDKEIPALVKGTDNDLRLLVEYADGTQDALGAGEVSIRL